MNLIEHLEFVIGLVGKATDAEIKGALLAMEEEVRGTQAAADKYLALQKAQRAESQAPSKPAVGDLVENMGVLWRKTATGYEPHPYCKHCAGNPVMSPIHRAQKWVCATGEHVAPFTVKPPVA